MESFLEVPRKHRTFVLAAACLAFVTAPSLRAEIFYYLDPDWNGARTGSSSAPWTLLDAAEWAVIESALASDDVTVYFSAREAGSDTNETAVDRIQILRVNSNNSHLTLDGMSRYNTNDSNPSWADYGGTRRFQITAPVPVSTANNASPFQARYNYTVRGFVLSGSSKTMDIAQSINATFEYNDISQPSTASNGPAFHLDNTAANNDGTLWSDGVVIRNNVVHDSFGEAIYINGHKTEPSEGNPSSNNVLIEGNTIYEAGSRGAQGDGIDIKDGVTNLVVRGNYISGSTNSGIVTDSGGIYEGNYIYDNEDEGLSMATIEGNFPNRANSIVRNNVMIGNYRGISVRGPGDDPDEWENLTIANNTIAFHEGEGITIDPGDQTNPTVNLLNNILWDNDGHQLYANRASMVPTHTNNLYGNTAGGTLVDVDGNYDAATLPNFEPSSLSADPLFEGSSTSSVDNFRLLDSSPCIGEASPVGSFTTDFFGFTRGPGSAWEIGAIEYDGTGDPPPDAPTGLHQIPQP